MYLKILLKDYKRKKVITIVLFVFILLAAMLAAGGAQMFLALTKAMDNLFAKANTAHYVQFSIGPYDEAYVEEWTHNNSYIKKWSVQKTLTPVGVSLHINENDKEMDLTDSSINFVVQNDNIDILLDLDNNQIFVSDGHIAVPIYYMKREGLKLGDMLTVKFNGYEKNFIISDFVRDAQYGNVMMTAKRFVLSEKDYKEMEYAGTDTANTFCFVLKDESMLRDFTRAFQSSDMPQNDYSVDISLFRLAYGSADGIVIGLVLLCSVLLVLVALLTLRYTILSTIEEDFREIGVMKAIGFKVSDIIKLYLSKYLFLTTVACTLGLILGQPLSTVMNTNLLLYLGTWDNGITDILASLGSVALIIILILTFCLFTLWHIGKMTVIDAFRMGNIGETYREGKLLSLSHRNVINVNIFIGFKDILTKLKVYVLLFVVFLLCAFICILPINVKNTFDAPESLSYFGYVTSDIMIYPTTLNFEDNINNLIKIIQNDTDVLEWAVYAEEYHRLKTGDGETQKFRTAMGNQTMFHPEYSSGTPPVLPNEIALSYLAAKDLNKGVGDGVIMEINGEDRYMLITGIYPDMSNGGRAVRSCLEPDIKNAFFWKICLNVKGDAEKKVEEYKELLGSVNISTLKTISNQFMGEITTQLNSVGILLTIIAMFVSVLITALFIKMLTAKETSQIAIMKSLGFTERHIRTQYFTRIGSILIVAIISGTIVANILGERIMSAVTATMGAVSVKFVIKPLEVYFTYPLILLMVVCVTIIMSCGAVRKISISRINAE